MTDTPLGLSGAAPWVLPPNQLVFPAIVPDDGGDTQLALQRTPDDELVVVGFTSLAGLLAAFGPGQRWLAFEAGAAPALLEGSGVSRILVDPDITFIRSPG